MLGSLIVLYWLYMGSQSRFYARWMLPLYPALAILAALRAHAGQAAASRSRSPPRGAPARHGDPDGPQRDRAWAARTRAARPATGSWRTSRRARRWRSSRSRRRSGTASTPGGGAKARPRASSGSASTATQAIIAELAKELPRRAAAGELPELRAHAHPGADRHLPARGRVLGSSPAPRSTAARRPSPSAPRRRCSTTARCKRAGRRRVPDRPHGRQPAALPGRQSFNYVDGAFNRPGPEMIVYRLRNCA